MLWLGRIRKWWTNRSRLLFSYWDGTTWHRADPMRIASALETVCPDYLELLTEIGQNPQDTPVGSLRDELLARQKASALKLIAAAYKVFNLKPLTDTEGVSDGEAMGALTRFFVFMEDLADSAQVFGSSPDVA